MNGIARALVLALLVLWVGTLVSCGVQSLPIPPEDVKKSHGS